jgi:hypothetical protein
MEEGKVTDRDRGWRGRLSLRWLLGVFAVAAFFAARPLLAADISGSWDLSCQIGEERQGLRLELVMKGSEVTGTGTLRVDRNGTGEPVLVRAAGTVKGWDFKVSVEGRPGGRPQEFRGSWYKNEMSGISSGEFGSRLFTGSRRTPPE